MISIHNTKSANMSTVATNAITYTNGDSYTGQILAHGIGRMVYANGDVYGGHFYMGKRNNKGTYKYNNGEKYSGQWKDNMLHGQGIFTYKTGDVYNGEFFENKRHGRGDMLFEGGARYKGLWTKGKCNGLGVMTTSKLEYNGEWRNNLYHGKGTLTCSEDGSSYTGLFNEGKKHGKGVAIFENGEKVIEGYWISDQLLTGKILEKNGDVYEGELRKYKKHGRGKITYKNGDTFIGSFTADERKGQGNLHAKDDTFQMEGYWNANKCLAKVICDIEFDITTKDYNFEFSGQNGKRVASEQLGPDVKKRVLEKLSTGANCLTLSPNVEQKRDKLDKLSTGVLTDITNVKQGKQKECHEIYVNVKGNPQTLLKDNKGRFARKY